MNQEWADKDYYQILGVSKTASQDEIKKKYRKLAKELHPDANPGNAKAEARFKEVSEAYDVVGSEVSRKEYDEFRDAVASGAYAGGFPGGGGYTQANFEDTFLEALETSSATSSVAVVEHGLAEVVILKPHSLCLSPIHYKESSLRLA